MSDTFKHPLTGRYAGPKMQALFSDAHRVGQWRRLWLALAETQQRLGLDISDDALEEMRAHLDDIDWATAHQYETTLRHDVMAHIHAFGDAAPKARGILHLGATSAYIVDNTDLIMQREALTLLRQGLLGVMRALADFAQRYIDLPVLAYTHFQPAQPTTLGKRATLWLHDLQMDVTRLGQTLGELKFLGCRGTTGTAASFLALFEGDAQKVHDLETQIAQQMGFQDVYPVSGQTYSRKVDSQIMSVLSDIAQSAHKFANDVRLMAHLKAVVEPFESGQVGSSAMAYKRNPMRAERLTALARYLIVNTLNPALTASEQWFERTLDDSANRRMVIPEAFLAADAIVRLTHNLIDGLTVRPEVFARQLQEELPFLITENVLMEGVRRGADRQDLHEVIRQHSLAAADQLATQGPPNDLLDRLAKDPAIPFDRAGLDALADPAKLTGLATEQTRDYLASLAPLLSSDTDTPDPEPSAFITL